MEVEEDTKEEEGGQVEQVCVTHSRKESAQEVQGVNSHTMEEEVVEVRELEECCCVYLLLCLLVCVCLSVCLSFC